MASHHQTIVVELGTSRIKVGYAGESRPRRVLDDRYDDRDDGGGEFGGWTVGIDDGMPSRSCRWTSLFRRYSTSWSSSSSSPSSLDDESPYEGSGSSGGGAISASSSSSSSPTSSSTSSSSLDTTYEWERTLYPLFSHVLTSILFVQRPSRHRVLILTSDLYVPRTFDVALHRVLLDYLGVGSMWLSNGGTFLGAYHLFGGFSPNNIPLMPTSGPSKARMFVDIGTHEARAIVCVSGYSTLPDTLRYTSCAGYASFLGRVLWNYRGGMRWTNITDEQDVGGVVRRHDDDESTNNCDNVSSLEDANAVVRAWISLSSSSSSSSSSSLPDESATMSVRLPSLERRNDASAEVTAATIRLPIEPLLRAFREVYLDYANPSSLIFAMLSCALACPVDYRRSAMQHALLMGGGSVALRHFRSSSADHDASRGRRNNSAYGLGVELEMAARDACGGVPIEEGGDGEVMGEEEEKKCNIASCMSSIAKKRFHSLRGVIRGHVDGNDGDNGMMGGINIQYPDPFAADMVAWLGGSIMGTLGYPSQYQSKFPRGER
ncbi:hypothetical protein ACHAXA_001210 [Cyclostephanos tholiformis]|uniref:Uncharacterized protein n=1 Tax=Cyclostephanos tholiformis TaxID=382380 RepID=A0ABD3SR07_9STRA